MPIKDFIIGAPFYHMWYLYMMIGVYLLVPVIFLFINQIGERIFNRVVRGFIVAASLSFWTSTNKLYWDIGLSFQYAGYFMVGYELRRLLAVKKSNMKGCALIAAGVLTEIAMLFLKYEQVVNSIGDDVLKYKLGAPLGPLTVIASTLIFAGFSCLNIKKIWVNYQH